MATDKLNEAVAKAEAEMAAGNWTAATKSWQYLAPKLPDSPKVWVKLSRSARMSGDLDLAISTAEGGLTRLPKEKELFWELAKAATKAGDWAKAAQAWQQTTMLFGAATDHKMRLEQARAKAELTTTKKQWQQALTDWQAVISELGSDLGNSLGLEARFNVSVLTRLIDIDDYKRAIERYQAASQTKKIAIVTAFSQGYDTLKPPQPIDDRYDYFCYTDDPNINDMGIYQIRPFPQPKLDPARAIRYVKTHPHVLFQAYEVVVWLDAAVMIVGDIYPLIEKFNKSSEVIGSGVHPLRKNIYEEFEAGKALGKESPKAMQKQIDVYKKAGFEHSDLAENTMLMFKPASPKLAAAMETWWEQICKYSKRDQLSFNYSLAQSKLGWFPLTKPPQHIRNHPLFVWMPHHSKQPALEELVRQLSKRD